MTPRCEKRLEGVHPDLVAVVHRADELLHDDLKFIVTEGVRSLDKQAKLVQAGASQTMNSRHLTGHAVDLAAVLNGEVRWDWPLYAKLNDVMQDAAHEFGVKIIWGGTWRTLRDGPHWELDRSLYA